MAADNLIKGEDVRVYIYDGGQWKIYACALTCTLVTSTEFIETSTLGTGINATFIPTKNQVTGSISGLVSLGLTSTLSLPELRAKQLSHTKFLARYERTSQGGDTYTDEVYFYIQSCSDEGPHDSMHTFSIELRGTGALTQSFTPTTTTPPGQMHDYYYPSNGTGETSFTYAPSIGKDPMGAWIQMDYEIITSGTPNATQIKYTSATGTWEWLNPLDPDQVVHIQYQD